MLKDIKLSKESIKDLTIDQVRDEMQKEIAKYQAEVATMDLETLEAEEDYLVENYHKINDEYYKTIEYDLAKNVEFDGEKYSRNTIAGFIVHFLNQVEVGWSESLGMYQMVKFWRSGDLGKVPYAVLDNLLRILGSTCKYKGEADWRSILIINDFLTSTNQAYMKDYVWLQYCAMLHDTISKAMDALNKAEDKPATEEA